jgi:hypothetical protein
MAVNLSRQFFVGALKGKYKSEIADSESYSRYNVVTPSRFVDGADNNFNEFMEGR